MLERIEGPADLKGLDPAELTQLADEVRAAMVSTVSRTGGHLASSLGAVELTIALHRVFDSPKDKIIWDVGHQSYAHKMLTGRMQQFHTLRQYHGLSGFPDKDESPHDPFGTGHASTSVSAAMGIATARDLAGDDYQVVAVIGDGSLTGGLALEALNQVGHLRTRIIVILNDNAMAISPSVGALSRALNLMTLDRRYYRAKEEAGRVIKRMPWGNRAWFSMHRIKSGLREILIPTQLWETLGFKYVGPVNGHDMVALEEALVKARDYAPGPVFLHVVTTKGKGYEPAEEDCVKFHGVSGKINVGNGNLSYSEVFADTLLRLFRQDERLVAITAAMMEGTGLNAVAAEFPERVFDMGICEQHVVTFAAGLASQGYIPIAAIYSTFLQRAFDQVLHDVCIQNLPVVFAIDRAGIVGEDGKSHQGTFDLSYLGCIPNLVLAAPRDENELGHLLFTAAGSGRPMAVRYPRGCGAGVPRDEEFRELPIGKGELLRSGEDVAIIAIGCAVHPSLEAASALEEKGIACAVVDARYAKPLDSDLILEVTGRAKRVVTVEENALAGGFGSSVLALMAGSSDTNVLRIGIPDEFVEHGRQDLLRADYGLDSAGILNSIVSCFPDLHTISPRTSTKR
jgi:1-deoxy-D-xylulose-5-phosphate synthase